MIIYFGCKTFKRLDLASITIINYGYYIEKLHLKLVSPQIDFNHKLYVFFNKLILRHDEV